MKSAKEWHDWLLEQMNEPAGFCFCKASVEDIAAIQADAIKDAQRSGGPVTLTTTDPDN